MSAIAQNIRKFRQIVPPGVEIVAVSKFHPASMIMEAYEAGQRNFGESRVQEFVEKERELPKDIRWHFIGHLQTNKVKAVIGKTSLIESVDSERLLELIDRESEKAGVITNVLLQVHVAAEEAKFGFFPEELKAYFESGKFVGLKATKICGLMGMATNTDDVERIRNDFSRIHTLFEEVRSLYSEQLPEFTKLSMGMSGDWEIAMEEGSNIVRIGSAIFGERNY
ncbi:MAG: YggS family pyridoxal phosphate-dependent enzyme [Muribaculaceae bacterium]|nr:YggS family pyridoxal phosphate-dependent enzyme [Muribaculaceae bacterium]